MTFDTLHVMFAMLESYRAWSSTWPPRTWEEFYPGALLGVFPWFHYPFYRVTLVCSIYMIIAVAIERCFAVCYPHYYHNLSAQKLRALYYILPAVAAALLLNIPKFLEMEIIQT